MTEKRNLEPYEDVSELIGWTPLIRLTRVTRGIRTPVYGKAEFFNPGGSIKDRIGAPIIEQAEREGRLRPGGTAVGVTITSAPNALSRRTFSCDILSGIVKMHL
jgi:cystathionine beta-synthase